MELEHREAWPMVVWARSQGAWLQGVAMERTHRGREGPRERSGLQGVWPEREGATVGRDHRRLHPASSSQFTQSPSTAICLTWSASRRTVISPLRKTCCAVACPPQASMSTASPCRKPNCGEHSAEAWPGESLCGSCIFCSCPSRKEKSDTDPSMCYVD